MHVLSCFARTILQASSKGVKVGWNCCVHLKLVQLTKIVIHAIQFDDYVMDVFKRANPQDTIYEHVKYLGAASN